jgi:hypothetical protein
MSLQIKKRSLAPGVVDYFDNQIDSVDGKVNQEILDRQAAITAAESLVSAEESRAEAAELALGSRIDSVISNTDPAALDSLSEIVSAFEAADSNLNGAITALGTAASSALGVEVARAEAAEAALASADSAEQIRAMAKETELENSISDLEDSVILLENEKEDKSNKSLDVALGSSNELYPSQGAVKVYVDVQDKKLAESTFSGVALSDFLPNTASIETQVKHYTSGIALASDKKYSSYFTDTEVVFVNAVNPYASKITHSFTIPTGGSNFPQAMTSVGNYVYMVTGGGRLYCFDWSDKLNPLNLGYVTIGTGQHFDVTTDGQNTLFIANTTNKRVYIVDITNRAAGTLTTSLVLGTGATDFGTGVSFSSNYLYVSNYNGKIHVMSNASGSWLEVTNFSTIANPCRGTVFTNSSGQKLFFVQRYNGVDIAVYDLADPALPVELKRLVAPAAIQLYNLPFIFEDIIHIGLDNGQLGAVNVFNKNDIKFGGVFEPKNLDGSKKFSSMRGLVLADTASPFFKKKKFLLATGVVNGSATTQKVTTVIDFPIFDYIKSSAITVLPPAQDLSVIESEISTVESTLSGLISTERSRVDAILSASEADKDTFVEIVQLINSVDTTNDQAFAGYVLSNDAALAQEISNREAGDSSALASANSYTDAQIATIPAVDLSAYYNKTEIDAKESALASDISDLDVYAQDIRSDVDAQELEIASHESRLDALEILTDGPSFSNGSVIVGAELGFIDLDKQYIKLMSCAVGRLMVHEGEDFTVSVVDGKTRLTWIGSLVNPDGAEAIETGDKVFFVGAY